jgi:prophage regulatory protein
MQDRLLTFSDLAAMGLPFTRQHLARLEHTNSFPKRLQLGSNRVAWRQSEIQDWLNSRERGPLPLVPNALKATADAAD